MSIIGEPYEEWSTGANFDWAKNKLDKENVVETIEVESSDAQATSLTLQQLASQISDKLSSSSLDICQEIAHVGAITQSL
ncbi:hypothetical protein HA466_0290830 [Hirschfeldia incana]|nr:hypothetical protein HA466_0290830 [Hirschfeldia incana]